MALDLTPIARVELRLDRLTLPDDATLEFLRSDTSGYVVLKTLTQQDDWSVTGVENLYINIDFVRLTVLEFAGFEEIWAKTEAFRFDGIIYKAYRAHRPVGLPREWTFKLEPIEDFSSSS
jgi:hypothetical protein